MDIRKQFSPAGGIAAASRPGEDDDTMPGPSKATDEDKLSEADTDKVDKSRENEVERGCEITNDPPPDNSNPSTTNRDQSCFIHLHRDGRHLVYCGPCSKESCLVKRFAPKGKLPPITLSTGTVYRKPVTDGHVKSEMHRQVMRKQRLDSLSRIEVAQVSHLDKLISTANEHLANKIGSLLIHVYGDGKKLSLSANSFPIRVVTSIKSHSFNFNNPSQEAILDKDLQYVTPKSHFELLKCIVESDRQSLSQKIHNSIAISLRCDGSVDRTQIDKIYVLAKLITMTGDEETVFLGAHEPETRGAQGVFNVVEQACNNTVGKEVTQEIFSNMSSIVTDGASVNTGDNKGIWAAFDRTESEVPKMKIWCAVHRSQLAWKSITGKYGISEISHLSQTLGGISSFFHTSGVRTRELNALAAKHGLKCCALPRVFEVRWTEFTSSLINAILTSWRVLVLYFQESKDKATSGFLMLLTNKCVLELMAFVADVLAVFSRFQKKIQSDSVTLLDLDTEISLVTSKLVKVKETPLLGGWVETLQTQLDSTEEDGQTTYRLKNIALGEEKGGRTKDHHLCVTGKGTMEPNKTSLCSPCQSSWYSGLTVISM